MRSAPPTGSEASPVEPMVRVWDLFVRVCHWTVAAAFFIAYVTDDDVLTLHVWAGYTLGVLVVMRIVWGFIGPKHARFRDFVYPPARVWSYLIKLITFRAKRHLGHSPAGGAMALVLLLGSLATVWTGLELYAAEEKAGPLASVWQQTRVVEAARAGLLLRVSEDEDDVKNEKDENEAGEAWEDVHEALAEVMFALVLLHIGGVLFTCLAHRENLIRAMVSGLKRDDQAS